MTSPLQMYSKFVLANHLLSQILKLAGKWPMADCYFRLCRSISLFLFTEKKLLYFNTDNYMSIQWPYLFAKTSS